MIREDVVKRMASYLQMIERSEKNYKGFVVMSSIENY